MNGNKSDATTSTADDVKDVPLCFFYFTHPFGIVSPEAPLVSGAPPAFARAFLNMEPVEPFLWTPSAASPASPSAHSYGYGSSPAGSVRYELGSARVHAAPLSVTVAAARRRRCAVELPRRDSSLSSTLFAGDLWLPPSSGEFPRRAPYARMLPPLRLPSPRDLADCTSEDVWPRKCLNRFSLPPIELPPPDVSPVRPPAGAAAAGPGARRREELSSVESSARCRRQLGVRKTGRGARGGGRGRGCAADVRRMVTCLMRRAVTGRGVPPPPSADASRACSPPPQPPPPASLHHVLSTIREAWAEPTSLKDRCRAMSRMFAASNALERDSDSASALAAPLGGESEREGGASAAMLPPPPPPGRRRARADLALPPRPDASPGLFRRRYSVPETIMRKYRLAQQNSESEECGTTCGEWGGDAGCGPCASLSPTPSVRSAGDSPRHLRRDRELMRKSALLRRMWARPAPAASPVPATSPATPTPACTCETRSLDGSRDELHATEGGRTHWPDRKRQCFGPRFLLEDGDLDAPSDATASPQPATPRTVSTSEEDSFPTSTATAKETPALHSSSAGLVSSELLRERLASPAELSVAADERTSLTTAPPLARPYEVLEITVSESSSGSPPARSRPHPHPALYPPRGGIDLDEYVSRVLVESLHSLSDRLQCVGAAAGAGDHRVSVVQKEIKVRLQNAAVNTIVHLSPTSNHQIIFGNEELCDGGGPRDSCNNLCAPATLLALEDNNNVPSVSPSPTPTPTPLEGFDIRHDTVNRAVLHQIQKLFRDELHRDQLTGAPDGGGGPLSHIDISNVGVFLSPGDEPSPTSSGGDAGAPITGVGAGNYYPGAGAARFALVPRCSALPHSVSMEVNTSSSEDAEGDALASDAASLVDSLDDPASPRAPPRVPPPRPRPALARSTLDVLDLLPDGAPSAGVVHERDGSGGEAFFVRIRDDAPAEDAARVAECMPERIRQRLHRRHRKRELRVECARRGRVRQLRDELERRRRDELAQECSALLDDLLDDVIAGAVHDEYRGLRVRRRDRDAGRREAELHRGGKRDARRRVTVDRDASERGDRQQVRGQLVARPSLAAAAGRGSRRIYQKSEIHEGDKCIEILEILEFSHASRSSPESTPTEEGRSARPRRSRIPVPCAAGRVDHMRLSGGGVADLLLRALATSPPDPPAAPASSAPRAALSEPRSRSNSLRFKRVFDMIPEERPSLSFDSSDDTAAVAGLATPPALTGATRSAATSPPAEAQLRTQTTMTSPAEARLRTQTTMTSPRVRSAATSPPPPPRPLLPPRLARAGSRERSEPARPGRRSSATHNDGARRASRAAAAPHPPAAVSEDGSSRTSAAPPAGECSPAGAGRGERSGGADSSASSSSGESGGSLLCSLAPRWLSAHARQRRRPRRAPQPAPPPEPGAAGGWSVTVAGSCRATLPADVEMRLRFPHERHMPPAPRDRTARASSAHHQKCTCGVCAASDGVPPPAPALPPAPTPARPPSWLGRDHDRVTLTMKKEAQVEADSCAGARRSRRGPELPDLDTYRATRTNANTSFKTRRGYSLHCWLPDGDEPAPLRASNGLSVLGCAIIPELKPRVPTMSERDLTRVYTPRHYLRS